MSFIDRTTRTLTRTVVLTSACLLLMGCVPESEITTHRVPKDQSGLKGLREYAENRGKEAVSPIDDTAVKTRMVVAWFETDQATWFFKVTGPVEQVDQSEQAFLAFFDQVKFEGGEPVWELPKGWTEAGPKPMRFKTLLIDGSTPPLELAISNLGPGQDRLLNINRWRRQIGLLPASQEQLNEQLPQTGEYWLFDQTGIGSGKMKPAFAGGNPPFAGGGQAPFANKGGMFGGGQAEPKITFAIPDGWQKGKSSSIVQARLTKQVDDAEAMITVIEMPAAANEWKPNVDRWAGQVGLKSLDDAAMQPLTFEVKLAGETGQMIRLFSSESANPNGTIAGMVKRGESAWFLKLTGDKELVKSSEESFLKFIDSIRFE